MGYLIDFSVRAEARRDLEAFRERYEREQERLRQLRVYESRQCGYDGRSYRHLIGSDDTGFCRPACAEAAVRPGRGRA